MKTPRPLAIAAILAALAATGETQMQDNARNLQDNPVPAAGQNAGCFFPEEEADGPRILFVGNSISLHGPRPEIGWTNNWGMAATSRDRDYVHLLKSRLAARGPAPAVAILQVAEFERAFDTFDIAPLGSLAAGFRPDIVVMFFGANVTQDYDGKAREFKCPFGDAYASLRDSLAGNGGAKVIHLQGFYIRPVLDAEKKAVAASRGDAWLELGTVRDDPAAHGMFNHPNDAGMAAIADVLWPAIEAAL